MEALRSRSAAAWMQLFDDRYRAQRLPVRLGRVGQEGVGLPFIDNENIVSMYEGSTNLFWADRYGKQLRVEDLWVKQCGNSHTGSFKDLGMTVLVSRGQADDRRRRAHRRRRLRLHRRHLGRARRLLRGGRHPRRGAAAEGQGLDRPARAAARQRRARALARHRLRRLHGDRAGDHQGEADLPGQLDEQPAHRGAEDGGHRDRAAVRLGGAGLDHHPGRQPRQRARARAGLRDDAGARADQQAAAHLPGPGRARQPALPLVPGRLQDASSPSSPSRRWPPRSRSATR